MDKPPDDMPMPAGFRHKVKRLQKECCTRTSHGKEGGMERYEQTTLFPKEKPADVMPSSTSWNLWHGCINYVVLHIICVMRFYSYVEQV